MDKIKSILKDKFNQLKSWYLLKWKTHKPQMIMIHIFVFIVLIAEIIS
jgi:hypothetical protein